MKHTQTPRLPDAPNLELDATVTIVKAAELHRTLAGLLAAGQPVIVDATHVEEIDTAVLQLLVSLWRTGNERGIDCRWHGVSEPLRRTARLVGVAGMLHFPEADAARGSARAV